MATLPLAIDARGARAGAAQYEQAGQRVIRSSTAMAGKVGMVDRKVSGLGKTAQLVKGHLGGLFVGLGAAVVLRKTIQNIVQFENTMLTVKGVTGATEAEFAKLSQTARTLGATTRYSAREAGEGLLFLARAGFDTQQAIAALPATLNLATAGGLELGAAADFASNILSQFRLQAEQTERVVDTLIHTANSANTTVLQLAEAMKMAGPVAGALGIQVENLSAAIGVLGDSGIQSSMAGTQLRGTMAALLKPSGDAQKSIAKMSLTLEEISPATNTLTEIFEAFKRANLSAADAVEIFGRRNAAAALTLTANTEKLRELTRENIIAQGEAKRLAEMMDSGLGGAFRNLKSTMEEVMLRLGDRGLTGALKGVVELVTDVSRGIMGLTKDLKTGESLLKNNETLVMALAKSLEFLVKTIVIVIGLKLAAWLWASIIGIGALTSATVMLTSAWETLALVFMLHPILAIAGVIAIAATALYTFTDRVGENTEALRIQREELDKMAALVPLIADAQKEWNRAFDEGNILKQADAIQKEIDILDAYLTKLHGGIMDQVRTKDFEDMIDSWSKAYEDFLKDVKSKKWMTIKGPRVGAAMDVEGWAGGVPPELPAGYLRSFVVQRMKEYKEELDMLNPALERLRKAKADAAAERAISLQEIDDMKSAAKELDKIQESLSQKTSLVGLSKGLREAYEFRAKIGVLTEKAFLSETLGATEAFAQRNATIQQLMDIYKLWKDREQAAKDAMEAERRASEGYKSLTGLIKRLEQQKQILTKINVERNIETNLMQARNIAEAAGIELTSQQIEMITKLTEEIYKLQEADRARLKLGKELTKELTKQEQELKRVTDAVGKSIGDAFASMVTGAKSAQEAIRDLATEILSLVAQETISKPIAGLISNLIFSIGTSALFGGLSAPGPATIGVPSGGFPAQIPGTSFAARGLAFAGRFQSGGVVHGPTYAMMGEAGPEAIMPLARDSSGRLGIRGGGETSININIINESSQPVSAEQGSTEFNGEGYVVSIVLKDLHSNGRIRQTLKSME